MPPHPPAEISTFPPPPDLSPLDTFDYDRLRRAGPSLHYQELPVDAALRAATLAPFEAAWLVAGATDTSIETPAGGRALALHFLANVYILGRPRGHAAHADTLLPHRARRFAAAAVDGSLPHLLRGFLADVEAAAATATATAAAARP